MAQLQPVVHRFSMSMYDASRSGDGPNAPYRWITSMLKRLSSHQTSFKILIGLPFYGYDEEGKTNTTSILIIIILAAWRPVCV